MITKPTRCNSRTANILDLIFTNSDHIFAVDTWEMSFSDHQPVYVIQKQPRTHTSRTSFLCHSFGQFIREDFPQDLTNHDWTDIFRILCPEEAWLLLYNTILECADKHCPYKDYTSKRELPPWLNNEILELLNVGEINSPLLI